MDEYDAYDQLRSEANWLRVNLALVAHEADYVWPWGAYDAAIFQVAKRLEAVTGEIAEFHKMWDAQARAELAAETNIPQHLVW